MNVISIREKANKLSARGKYKKALQLFRQVTDKYPNTAEHWRFMGDLYKRNGDELNAIQCYERAANLYTQDGFMLKAISIIKIIHELAPDHADVKTRLDSLHQQKQAHTQQVQNLGLQSFLEAFKKKREQQTLEGQQSAAPKNQVKKVTNKALPLDADDEALLAAIETEYLEINRFPHIPLFDSLNKDEFESVVAGLKNKSFNAEQNIITEGEASDALYILTHGTAKVYKHGAHNELIELGTMEEGSFFGEIGLLEKRNRTATVTAKEDVDVLVLERAELVKLVTKHPQLDTVIEAFYQHRLLRTVLRFDDAFEKLDEAELDQLIKYFKMHTFAENKKVLSKNQRPTGMWVVESGSVTCQSCKPPQTVKVGGILAAGACQSLSEQKHEIRATETCRLFELPLHQFHNLNNVYPEVVQALVKKSLG